MKGIDLTRGPILSKILKLALPLMATQFINTAYNLTDLFWLGQDSAYSVGAVGAIGLFIWLSFSINLIVKIGCEILVARKFGAKDYEGVKAYSINSLFLIVIIAIIYVTSLFLLNDQVVNFFAFDSQEIIDKTYSYLDNIYFAIFFLMVSNVFVGINNGIGNTKSVLLISSIGLIVNMILDPLFILKLGMGTKGAAYATTIGSFIPFLIYFIVTNRNVKLLKNLKKIEFSKIKDILSLSYVVCIHNVIFTSVGIFIGKFIVIFGDDAIVVNRIGSQVESLVWMVAISITTSVSVFTAQNMSAKHYHRIANGFSYITLIMMGYALLIGAMFILFGRTIYDTFVPNEPYISDVGATYLFYQAFAQIPIIFEGIISGFFNGQSKTKLPAFVSISGNLSRIVFILVLSDKYGLNGVWIAIAISSIWKGMFMLIAFMISVHRSDKFHLSQFFIKDKKYNV